MTYEQHRTDFAIKVELTDNMVSDEDPSTYVSFSAVNFELRKEEDGKLETNVNFYGLHMCTEEDIELRFDGYTPEDKA